MIQVILAGKSNSGQDDDDTVLVDHMSDPIFRDETAWDALIENFSLDMLEEDAFEEYLMEHHQWLYVMSKEQVSKREMYSKLLVVYAIWDTER